MRVNIVHPNAGELRYEIRGIVDFAQKLAETGIKISWENIGDPIAKGEIIPNWICDVVAEEVKTNMGSYGYSPTKGLVEARAFLALQRSAESNVELSPNNILFFNGLGDAISKIYSWLHPDARILGPNPSYPSHALLEAAHGTSSKMLTYPLRPEHQWLPDMTEVRQMVIDNPNVAGLLLINPDNPTGMIYPRDILEEFVAIAREYDLFLIADEIYAKLAYEPQDFISLAELSGDVPTIVMRGLSKEIPWPGSRCGWIEFYNIEDDPDFSMYVQSIEEAKMAEVCSTTLPQAALPKILGDGRYPAHLKARREHYARRAHQAAAALNSHPALNVVEPKGAFYLSVTFSEAYTRKELNVASANPEAQLLLDIALEMTPEISFDKSFCYHLMASTGICVVPLSTGFNSSVQGFRMTLLELDDGAFQETLDAIKKFCG